MPEPTEPLPVPADPDPAIPDAIDETPAAGPIRRDPGLSRTAHAPAKLWMIGAVLTVAVVAALVAWFFAERAQQAMRVEVAQRLAGIETSLQLTSKLETQLGSDLRDAQAKIALLEARVSESQAQQAALEALYRDLAPSRDEISISEIEQVVVLASQQLELAGNVSSALTALQLADAKLQRLDRPQFLPLRRALARDIDRLKAVPFVDVAGMSLKLDQAILAVDALPLAMEERLPPAAKDKVPDTGADSMWARLFRDLWNDAKQLVRIEVTDQPVPPLVPMPQQYFLRENLKLRLLTARIALLARDEASFEADLAAAQTWLKQYFDTRAKTVQAVQTAIRQLASTPMPGEIPDLARTLEALRVLRLGQDRASGRSAAPTPAR
jgi:uroporphyrin-3 C-methyltransferase